MGDPRQLVLPGMKQETMPGLELRKDELLLLIQLASTGRDLLRGHLLANQIPAKEVFKIKRVVTRADGLLDRLTEHMTNDQPN